MLANNSVCELPEVFRVGAHHNAGSRAKDYQREGSPRDHKCNGKDEPMKMQVVFGVYGKTTAQSKEKDGPSREFTQ